MLTPDRLATLPAVPDSVWKNARPEGHVKPKARIEIDSRANSNTTRGSKPTACRWHPPG